MSIGIDATVGRRGATAGLRGRVGRGAARLATGEVVRVSNYAAKPVPPRARVKLFAAPFEGRTYYTILSVAH